MNSSEGRYYLLDLISPKVAASSLLFLGLAVSFFFLDAMYIGSKHPPLGFNIPGGHEILPIYPLG